MIELSRTLNFIDIRIFTSYTKCRRFIKIPSVSVETHSVTLEVRLFPFVPFILRYRIKRGGNGVLLHEG